MSHLDPFGTLLILIAGFGWARPVPVNRFNLKKPRLAGVLVSFAGPLSNLFLACIGLIVAIGLNRWGYQVTGNFRIFIEIFIQLNIVLFVFNLIPLPPLDGYRILEDLAPNEIRAKMTQYEQYGILIFIILVVTPLDRYTIQPIFSFVLPWVTDGLGNFFYSLFF